MRALLLHNPTAGTGLHDRDDIEAALKLAGFDTQYVSTKGGDAAAALRQPADLLVVGGGDGTVRFALTRLTERERPVALLPLGSANNIARSLGIAGTPHQLAESWHLDHARRFDLGVVTRDGEATPFVEGFGLGVIAETILRRTREAESEGADDLRRGRATLRRTLDSAAPLDATLTIDGRRFDGDFLGIEVLNTGFTGPGLPLACDADPGDGLLDVIALTRDRRAALIDWIEAPLDCEPPVAAYRGRRIAIAWRDAPSRIDDTAQEANGAQSAQIALSDAPLRVLMPVADPIHAHQESGR